MCGRMTLQMSWAEQDAHYHLGGRHPTADLPFSYNLAPYQYSAVIRRDADGQREAVRMRWALIPSFEPKPTTKLSTINARAETVATSRLYAPLFKSGKRCLVPASGFFEWADVGNAPHYITPTDEPWFTFAGLWNRWEPPAGSDPNDLKLQPIDTFTVITTASNRFMAPLHERMPAVLDPEEWDEWLDLATPVDRLLEMLKPHEWPYVKKQAVSDFVNKTKNNSLLCIAPIKD
jgi:putative SOS response-associated peptidase YedK